MPTSDAAVFSTAVGQNRRAELLGTNVSRRPEDTPLRIEVSRYPYGV